MDATIEAARESAIKKGGRSAKWILRNQTLGSFCSKRLCDLQSFSHIINKETYKIVSIMKIVCLIKNEEIQPVINNHNHTLFVLIILIHPS
jgi:hypothetical protein